MRNVTVALLMVTIGLVQGQTIGRLHARAAAEQAIDETGHVAIDAPIVLLPDASRTPLASVTSGTAVRVLEREGTAAPRAPDAGDPATPRRAAPQANAPAQRSRTARSRRAPSWSDRGYVSVNGSFPATSNGFTGATAFTENVEAATLTATYGSARPPAIDVGGAARVWRNLALGAALTRSSQESDGTVSASIPHPFLFNTPRPVTGAVTGVGRRETGIHLNAAWVVPAGRKAQIAIFGGPSYFRVRQGLVNRVGTSSTYPYDTVTFVSANTVDISQSRIGFNAGADIIARAWRYVGVGAIVRYSRASLEFPVAPGQEVPVRAGGLGIGGGVRVAF